MPDVVIVVDSLVLLAEHVVHHWLVVLVSQDPVVLIHSASRLFPWLHEGMYRYVFVTMEKLDVYVYILYWQNTYSLSLDLNLIPVGPLSKFSPG